LLEVVVTEEAAVALILDEEIFPEDVTPEATIAPDEFTEKTGVEVGEEDTLILMSSVGTNPM
jgi:hypothetical protein